MTTLRKRIGIRHFCALIQQLVTAMQPVDFVWQRLAKCLKHRVWFLRPCCALVVAVRLFVCTAVVQLIIHFFHVPYGDVVVVGIFAGLPWRYVS
jgi:hypothetical protein